MPGGALVLDLGALSRELSREDEPKLCPKPEEDKDGGSGEQGERGEDEPPGQLVVGHRVERLDDARHRRVLDERTSHTAPKRRFVDELEDHMTEDAAEETLRTVVSWARFGELFSYDDESESFSLENPT